MPSRGGSCWRRQASSRCSRRSCSIRDTLLIVFLGIFAALVFEIPLRAFMRWTKLGRGLSATIVVLGTTVAVTVLALVLLVPLVGSLRDFLKSLPDLVQELRDSGELSWLGDSGAAENTQQGASNLADSIPHAISSILGVAGSAFSVGLMIFTLIFLALFLLIDMERLRGRRSQHADAGRRRTLARGLGERHRDGLPLGDRRAHDRRDRGHGAGRRPRHSSDRATRSRSASSPECST